MKNTKVVQSLKDLMLSEKILILRINNLEQTLRDDKNLSEHETLEIELSINKFNNKKLEIQKEIERLKNLGVN
ncbi:hypothetical protein ICS_05702 [Bacillus cereus BAG2O-3]|nr:hypothetical protein ICS_05702 [Bacillus cereus BAG2O-3]